MNRIQVAAAMVVIFFLAMLMPVGFVTDTVAEQQNVEVKSIWDVSYFTVNREDLMLARVLGWRDNFDPIFDRDWRNGGPQQVGDQTDYFGLQAETTIYVSKESDVHFEIGSDDYSELFVDDQLVVSIKEQASVPGVPFQKRDASRRLATGFHKLTLRFYEIEGDAHCSFSTDPDVTRWIETTTVNKTVSHPVLVFQKLVDLLVGSS